MTLLYLALTISLGVYILFGLFFLTGMRRIKISKKDITNWPTVSIVIAARNEEENLTNILQDLSNLDYPGELLEIVIADDRSTDNTWSLIKHFSDQHYYIHGVQIKEKSTSMTPKKYALTKAIEQSNGEIILSSDADCRIPRGWVKSMVEQLQNGVGIVVGSSSIDTHKHSPFSHYQLVDFLALVSANAGAIGWGFYWTGSGQNLAYKREFFQEINGFNPVKDRISGDDIYLVQTIGKKHGCSFNPNSDSFIKTRPSLSVKQFISQRIRWSSNSRFAAKIDLFFLLFLCNAFVINSAILVGIFTSSIHSFLSMILGLKFVSDALVIYKGAAKLHLTFPSSIFILWSILQPFYIPFIGLTGLAGKFKWKP
jgi:cellulose synthase/poly-beta-1,6-N-acetylglucosamine synthase-like glycosyltransferase